MEIAKYIGLFLLKNNFVYLPGLGNLEITKSAAAYDGSQLLPATYTVSLTRTGSIDDSLPNFIATNEQTSISKASNTLREFSIQSRIDLNEGKEVVIPAIGKFVTSNGRIIFITDPGFQKTPPAIPAQILKKPEEPKRVVEVNKPKPPKASNGASVNWGKIVIFALIAAVIVTAVIFAIRYRSGSKTNEVSPADSVKAVAIPPDTMMQAPTVIDSNAINTDTSAAYRDSVAKAASSPAAANGMLQYRVLLNNYDELARAQKREKQLNSFGNHVEVATKDSITFSVVMPISSMVADTAHVLDSLKGKFNPRGVSIYR